MIKTQGLTHIQLVVVDVKRSLTFYQDVFGMKVRYWTGPKMVFLNTPGSKDTITLRQAGKGEAVGMDGAGVSHFGFRLTDKADLDDSIRQVEAAGGKLLEQGKHTPTHPFAYVSDPDGYVIEL